jgi:tRNA (guanine-N7-)-methyltransferase
MSQESDKFGARKFRDNPGFIEHRRRVDARRAALADATRILPVEAGPCTFEIGCGHGHFLVDYAETCPERNFVGIDLIGRRLARARAKAEKRSLRNVFFLKAEAMEFLELAPAQLNFNQVFTIFPDPWPKKRHHRRRLIQSDFLTRLAERAIPGTRLYFRTDFTAYLDWAEEAIAEHTCWALVRDAQWPFESETYFEKILGCHRSFVAERVSPLD